MLGLSRLELDEVTTRQLGQKSVLTQSSTGSLGYHREVAGVQRLAERAPQQLVGRHGAGKARAFTVTPRATKGASESKNETAKL